MRKPNKKRAIPFAIISQKLVGQKYALGEVDCFSVILKYIDIIGIDRPAEFEGYTEESYRELYETDSEVAKVVMVEYLSSFLEEVQPEKHKVGDILLLCLPSADSLPFLAIRSGNSTIIAASEEKGVSVTPLKHYTILRAFQCHKQSL